jgi:methylase of polypeptide subunit release factors
LIDLGSGDGRIVIAFAQKGIESYGYEIIPLIYLWSLINVKSKNVKKAKIFLGDYWRVDLSQFDYVTVWGTPYMMERLEKKLQKELHPGAKVVSNHFQFPNWKAKSKKNDVYLYVSK